MPITRRRATDLLVSLDRSSASSEGLTRQIYGQLRAAILDGRLRAGDCLPPTRALASRLKVARLTVATAFEWLRAEGYVYGRVGAGTFVAAALEDYPAPERRIRVDADEDAPETAPLVTPQTPVLSRAAHVPLSAWARRIASIPLVGAGSGERATFDMQPGSGAADLFPWARWRRVAAALDPGNPYADYQARARESAVRSGQWDALLGPLETREAIAAWLRRSRAVRCDASQVLVAGSVQQVLALVARLLVEPGQRLLIEDPSYVGFHAACLAEGAELRGIPVDDQGLQVSVLPDAGRADGPTTPRLVIVTPSHQYPTGVTMSLDRRVALLEWARAARVLVVEDDYDGDLRLEGQPLEALRGLDERDEVIYLGTFAKALYPAVRLAYAVLPHWLIEPVARARAASDRHPTWRDALAVARFIESGDVERHLARVRRVYRSRRDALVATLQEELGDCLTLGPAEAGIHVLAALPKGTDDVAIERAALERGIALTALSPHYREQPRSGLLLGFGALPEERLQMAGRALAPLVRAACPVL